MDMRSMMLPAVSLLSRAFEGAFDTGASACADVASTKPNSINKISSTRSVASLRAWLYRSMARLFWAISVSLTVVRRAKSSSAQSLLLKK